MLDCLADSECLLEELEFEYCLPKWAWTSREWNRYSFKKLGYLVSIKEYKEYRMLCNKYKDEDGVNG